MAKDRIAIASQIASQGSIEIPVTVKVDPIRTQLGYWSTTVYGTTYEEIKQNAHDAIFEFFGDQTGVIVRETTLSVWPEAGNGEKITVYRAEVAVTTIDQSPF